METTYIELIATILPITMFVGIFVSIIIRDKKRREEIRNLADSLGWKYEGNGRIEELPDHLRSARASNVISGDLNSKASGKIFDLTVGTGKSKDTDTYIMIIPKENRVPAFRLYPENFLTKLGEKFGFEDIDFSEAPEFSDKYKLSGSNETDIRNYFNSARINYFATHPDMVLTSSGKAIVQSQDIKLSPEKWNNLVPKMRELADLFTR